MTNKELFIECSISSGYKQTRGKVDWKELGEVMYFRQSVEKEDWERNILSIIPVPVKIGKVWMIIPLGAYLGWRQVRKIVKYSSAKLFVGYSQGAWYASYASQMKDIPAITFGSPRLYRSKKEYFKQVTMYKNPLDIVTQLPPWALQCDNVFVNNGTATKPVYMSDALWFTGHTAIEYIQRLGENKCLLK